MTGCTSTPNTGFAEVSTASVPATTEDQENIGTPDGTFLIRFDRRGGGEPNINVYSDPTENGRGSEVQGTGYYSGVYVLATCVTHSGREVRTNPQKGEDNLSSSEWYRIETGDDEDIPPQYATGAYADALTEDPPEC